jgi:phosphatidylethanolamine/phosphatidyl-N-methylethanolamine N-methyltransferase
MIQPPSKRSTGRFADEIGFLRAWAKRPKSVGSIWPTGAPMARKMASIIDNGSGLPVLEIGPGTGTITKAILETGLAPEKLWSVEYSKEFSDNLRIKFPAIHVVEGDAFDLSATLGADKSITFDCAISALPLLNFPVSARIAFVEDILGRLPSGRPLIQFSYGPKSPVPPGLGNYSVKRFGMIVRNIPPAQLWIYSKSG